MADYQFNPNAEQWKEIPGFPRYEASNHGRIRSYSGSGKLRHQIVKILKSYPDKNGYRKVTIYVSGRPHYFKIHQLVLLTFVGPCPDGCESCHNDGINTNNRLDNLRWDTPKSNQNDRRKHGTDIYGFGEHHSQAKLTENEAAEVRRLYQSGISSGVIAQKFHINPGHVWSIGTRKAWKHLP